MTQLELKKIALQHFTPAPPGKGQLLHGAWITPKDRDSLQRFLEDVKGDENLTDEIRRLDREIEKLEAELEDKEALIDSLKKENADAAVGEDDFL
jgi:predicted  nucleic acid-binding Zn-ribbon protein